MMKIVDSNRQFKVVVIGNDRVGKTSFLNVYTNNTLPRFYKPTVAIDFKIKCMERNGQGIRVQFWDPAGHERFQYLVNAYYKGTMGFIYMFDLTDEKSFQDLKSRWHSSVKEHSAGNVPVIVVGNKVDLLATNERVMDSEAAKEFSNSINGQYMEVSCSNEATVEAAVMALVDMMLEHHPISKPTPMELDKPEEEKKSCVII